MCKVSIIKYQVSNIKLKQLYINFANFDFVLKKGLIFLLRKIGFWFLVSIYFWKKKFTGLKGVILHLVRHVALLEGTKWMFENDFLPSVFGLSLIAQLFGLTICLLRPSHHFLVWKLLSETNRIHLNLITLYFF